jgi:hypothetical protein
VLNYYTIYIYSINWSNEHFLICYFLHGNVSVILPADARLEAETCQSNRVLISGVSNTSVH